MGYMVREADLRTESASLLALWSRNAPSAKRQRYSWLYEANPAGPSLAWVATTRAGEMVGCAGLSSRLMKIGRRCAPTGQAVDLMVDARHRTAGPAVQLQRAVTASCQGLGIPLIYAFPNRQSEGVLRRAGYHVLGRLESWTKPLRSAYKIKNKATALIVDAALRLRAGEWPYRRPPGMRAAMLSDFDRRFDDLWRTASQQFPFIGDRSARYLRWRFGTYPARAYSAFGLIGSEDQLEAYLVFYRHEKRVTIADMLATDAPHLRTLLVEFSREMRSAGATFLTLMYCGASWVAEALRRVGFFPGSKEGHVLVFLGVSGHEVEELLKPHNWYLTEADRDV